MVMARAEPRAHVPENWRSTATCWPTDPAIQGTEGRDAVLIPQGVTQQLAEFTIVPDPQRTTINVERMQRSLRIVIREEPNTLLSLYLTDAAAEEFDRAYGDWGRDALSGGGSGLSTVAYEKRHDLRSWRFLRSDDALTHAGAHLL